MKRATLGAAFIAGLLGATVTLRAEMLSVVETTDLRGNKMFAVYSE